MNVYIFFYVHHTSRKHDIQREIELRVIKRGSKAFFLKLTKNM